jgi:hypothetical protein
VSGPKKPRPPKLVPDATASPRPEKRAYSSPTPPDENLRFRFGRLDHDKWALCKIDRKHHKRLLERLAHFEKMTVGQARANNLLADYDMSDCRNKSARTRLNNQYNGQDSLCRLTIAPGESLRLLGIREGNEFHIVWWDPNHEVWPEGKQVR